MTPEELRKRLKDGCYECGRPDAKGVWSFVPIDKCHHGVRWTKVCTPCRERVRSYDWGKL